MPNITIIGKEGHNVLQQTTANEVKITENSVVVIKVQKEDVKSMVQNGDALVITLKNGETIVIDNFFNNENNKNADDNTVVFEDQNGDFFLPGKAGADGVVLDYNPIESIEPLLYHDGAAPVLPWLLAGAGIATIAAIAGSGGDHNDRDTTPPTKPMIDPIEAGSKDPITGEGEPGGTVKVTYPDGTTATAPVGTDGKWTVPNPGLKDGEEVTAVVTDPSGNTSPPTTEKVEDTTPPIKPGIDPIEAGSKDPITGEGEPGGTVKVTYPDGTTATAPVGTDGKWTVPNPGLKDGDEVTAVVTDPSGNTSPPEKETVKDTIAPDAPDLNSIEAGLPGDRANDPITGKGEPGGKITVTYPDGTTATTTVDSNGKWIVTNPGLADGTIVIAVETDPAGNTSKPTEVTVKDTIPPPIPVIDPIEAGSKDPITGIAEDGTKVTVTFPDGTTATTTVGTDGKWTVPNPGLKDGDKVTAVATDPAGNTTVPTEVIVKDTIAPNAPDIDSINEANVKDPITGTGEPQATVTVTYPDGTTATTTVGTDGKWTVPNPGNLKNDDVITAIQTDPAGNPSLPATEKVDTFVETPKLSLEQDTGVSATDSITNDGKVNVSGLEAGGTWKYSTDGGTTWTTGTGTSFTLPEGTYDAGKVLVQQTDAVGNISTNGQLPATTVGWCIKKYAEKKQVEF